MPVTLRYDPEPPQLGFEPPSAGDPTLVAVQVTDKVSGLADGAIEISREGSDTWQALATQKDGSRLVARIDDAALPAGSYLLRATAHDQARNEASTDRRLDGQPMALTLPLRIVSTMQAGVAQRADRAPNDPAPRQAPPRAPSGDRAAAGGARADSASGCRSSVGSPTATVRGSRARRSRCSSRSAVSPEQLVAVLHTDSDGRYGYTATGSIGPDAAVRLRRIAAASCPTQSEVRLSVPGSQLAAGEPPAGAQRRRP